MYEIDLFGYVTKVDSNQSSGIWPEKHLFKIRDFLLQLRLVRPLFRSVS